MQGCFSGKRLNCCSSMLKPQVFSLFAAAILKKTKICGRKSVRFGRYAGLGRRSECLPPFYQFRDHGSANEKRFAVVGDRHGYCAARRTVSIRNVGSATGRVTRQSINTSRHRGTNEDDNAIHNNKSKFGEQL